MSASAALSPSYRGLRVLLTFMSVAGALGGLALLFGTSWFYWLLPNPLGPMDIFLLKGYGAVALGLSYLAFNTSRDPVRYVAVIDAIVIILVVAVLLQIYGLVALGADNVYPYHLFLISTIIRAALAVVLLVLRPRVPTIAA